MTAAESNRPGHSKSIEISLAHGFRFGEWSVIPPENRLNQGDRVVRLEPKVMQLLLSLISRHNQACTRESLLNELWPSPETGESSLTRAISELRKALGDQRKPARYIDTIQRIGYKAIAPIQPLRQTTENTLATGPVKILSQHEEIIAMARYLLVRRNGPDIRRAIQLLESHLSQHPYHAQLWAMLAHAKSIIPSYSEGPASLHISKARQHASHALELDGANGLAWAVLGTLAHYEWKWHEALEQYERAYSYQPLDPIILHGYAELLLNIGRVEQSQEFVRRACQLEPLAASAHIVLGWMMLHGQESQSRLELIKARQLGADTVFTDNLECLLMNRAGWNEKSLHRWTQLNQQRQHESSWIWPNYLLDALIDTGPTASLIANIRERVQLGQLNAGLAPFMLATAGAIDAAYEMTQVAIESRRFFVIDPWLTEMDDFRADSRFNSVLYLLGLSDLSPGKRKPKTAS